MKYLKIFEDFERSAYTKISPKTLIKGNEYLQEVCPFLNIDLYEDVEVVPGGNFLYDDTEYDSIESLIESVHENVLNIWDYRQHKYTINNGLLDVISHIINLKNKQLNKIPYKFGKVVGRFNCNQNNLTSLKGAPHTVVWGDFSCYGNKLTSLEDAPRTVGGHFWCNGNLLITLEGAPHTVEGSFHCDHNNLTSLEGAPHTVGSGFTCQRNQLTTLKGAPHTVGGEFDCHYNQLTTLEGAPHTIGGDFNCSYNQIATLEGGPKKVGKDFKCSNNQLTNLIYLPEEIGGNIYCGDNQYLTDFSDVPDKWKKKIRNNNNNSYTIYHDLASFVFNI